MQSPTKPLHRFRELCKITKTFASTKSKNNHLKSVRWAPDGSCFAVSDEEGWLKLFNLPLEYLNDLLEYPVVEEFDEVLKFKETAPFQDFCWFPLMDSSDPSTCFLFVCSKHSPARLIDAYSGAIKSSYAAFDHVERPQSANCLAVDWSARYLFCGFKRSVGVFEICGNGSKLTELRLADSTPRLPGIVSCIGLSQTHNLMAIGTFSKSLAIFDSDFEQTALLPNVHTGGLTQVSFVDDKHLLISGARKDSNIHVWDTRMLEAVPLASMQRIAQTNQRITFDVKGSYLCSGSFDGTVRLWNLTTCSGSACLPESELVASQDSVNGVSFNPRIPLLATSSGKRRFLETNCGNDSDDPNLELKRNFNNCDNSVRLWQISS